jgi:hypothetical protein
MSHSFQKQPFGWAPKVTRLFDSSNWFDYLKDNVELWFMRRLIRCICITVSRWPTGLLIVSSFGFKRITIREGSNGQYPSISVGIQEMYLKMGSAFARRRPRQKIGRLQQSSCLNCCTGASHLIAMALQLGMSPRSNITTSLEKCLFHRGNKSLLMFERL